MNAIQRLNTSRFAKKHLMADATLLLKAALKTQGDAALLCTREHAARHEAGHAALYLAYGEELRSVSVFKDGEHWLGESDGGLPWTVSNHTDPKADMIRAKILMAGPMAEIFTLPNPSMGAGVDEIAVVRSIVFQISHKTKKNFDALMFGLVQETLKEISTHRIFIETLSGALMHQKKVFKLSLLRMFSGSAV